LRAGADVHAVDISGTAAIHCAAKNGSVEALLTLLRHGARVNVKDKAGESPLGLAVMGGHSATARALLQARADPSHVQPGGEPLLLALCQRGGETEDLRMLLVARAAADQATPDGTTALQVVATKGHTDLLWELLRAGACSNLAAPGTSPPLYLAAMHGHAPAIQALLRAAADTNIVGADGTAAIAVAAQRGHTEAVHELVRGGADIEAAKPARSKLSIRRVGRARPGGLKFSMRSEGPERALVSARDFQSTGKPKTELDEPVEQMLGRDPGDEAALPESTA